MQHETHIYRDIKNEKNVIAWQVKEMLQHRMKKWALPSEFAPYWLMGELDLIDNVLYTGYGKRIPLEPDSWVIIKDDKSLGFAGADYFRDNFVAWVIEVPDLPAKPDPKQETDAVNHPAHYGGEDDDYEVIKVIEAWDLGFHLGNAVKYIGRAGKKDPETLIEDLEKSRWYIDRKIAHIKAGMDD